MGSVNKVILVGNLGKDPEVRATGSGIKVANFSIATSETWTDKGTGQKNEKTEWHNLVCWRGLAEVVEKYLKKGSQVYVEGKLTSSSWDKPDGTKGYKTEVLVDNLVMLGKRPEGSEYGGGSAAPGQAQDDTDTLPF